MRAAPPSARRISEQNFRISRAMPVKIRSCGSTLWKYNSSSNVRRGAENHADEHDRAGGDVLPEGGNVQKHQRLLQRTEQQYAKECANQTAAPSENVRAAKNDRCDHREFVAVGGVALHRAKLRGVKHRADGGQQAERDVCKVNRLAPRNAGTRGSDRGISESKKRAAYLRAMKNPGCGEHDQRRCQHGGIQATPAGASDRV